MLENHPRIVRRINDLRIRLRSIPFRHTSLPQPSIPTPVPAYISPSALYPHHPQPSNKG